MTKAKYPELERAAVAQRSYRARQALADAKAVLAGTHAPPPARYRRADVEYQLAGLEQELRDGLTRLEKADAANDHVAHYRGVFDGYVVALRRELDSPKPNVYEVAVCAMQAAWLARIWPVLFAARAQWRAPGNLADVNAGKRTVADQKRRRCLAIARELIEAKASTIRRLYQHKHPADPAPSESTIRRYLAPSGK